MQVQPELLPLPVRPAAYTILQWNSVCRDTWREDYKAWHKKNQDLDRQYLEAVGIIVSMLGAEPLAQIQQYMNIVDGRTKFIAMCNEIRNK
jgi:hypothetical protein